MGKLNGVKKEKENISKENKGLQEEVFINFI